MKSMIAATAAVLSVVFLAVTGASASIQCYDCHGTTATADIRPNDTAYRNITTGAFKGSHQTHMAPGATVTSCTPCHGGRVTSYTTSHREGFINLTSNVNGSPATGVYSRGTLFAQSSDPTLGTCSNVNCHFETVTPTWALTPLSAPADCNKCHGAAPADGSHPATSGSGKKHGDYYGLTTSSCARCHPDHTLEARPFDHATSAGNRGLIVQFTTAPNNGFGRYTGNVRYPNYLPSQNPSRNGTCRNLYCHSPGNKASSFDLPNNSATWGGSLSCKGCHKADIASGDAITSGSHQGHVNGQGIGYTQIKCVKCHGATVNSSMTIVNTGNHVNGQVTIAFDNTSSAAGGTYNGQPAKPATPSTKAPGSTYGSCQNVYCHSTGQTDGGTWPPLYTTPTWGSGATGKCGTCHGTTGSDTHGGFPGTMIQRRISSGSHKKHLSRVYGLTDLDMRCAICHAYDKTAFTSNLTTCGPVCHVASMPQKHANYEINVNIANYFGATATYNGSTTPGAGYSSCSSVYCHSDGKATPTTYATPTWGNAASGACGTCHGVTAAAPPASTPHTKHVGSAYPYRFACAECHSGKVQVTANATIAPAFANSTSHVNKTRDVKFDPTNPFGTYSSAATTCRNLYCHSTGNTSVAAANLPGVYGGSVYARQGWTGSVTCTSCHGRSTTNGMPDYTNAGAPGSATANSHPKHVTSSTIACNECHEKTTKNNTSIRPTTPSYHVAGTPSVFFNLSGANKNGTYNGTVGQKTCTNIYCHSNGSGTYQSPAPQWGNSYNCGSCHPIASLSATHAKHIDVTVTPTFYTFTANRSSGDDTTGKYYFGCSNCHPLDAVNHANGSITLDLRPAVGGVSTLRSKNSAAITAFGTAGTANSGTIGTSKSSVKCLNIYCHSNGYAANPVYATTPDWYGGSFTDRCASCHGNSPNSTINGSPAHYNTNFVGTGVSNGHVVGIHSDDIFTGTSGLATAGTGATNSHGNSAYSTTINCNVCHNLTVTSARNDSNVVCKTCHYSGNTVGALVGNSAAIANKALHVSGQVNVSFAAVAVKSKAEVRTASAVVQPYKTTWNRVGTYKSSGSYDQAANALNTASMWNGATKTCSNIACHNGQPVTWTSTGGATGCQSCHPAL
ncbi:cytochrome C family protein [Geobacter metallireducens RCH3]|uniref:Cytochrome c n=1 Tax=Geobacter metallireducens (strain ATCC 53774 / DSM 7210 / GS-15) TaxID=269799 RepID=Q39Y56_GEOMG|nr:CxxxxCH/CxxCH domain-containing protein [Geobacter metallireducens]ABB30818.1 cytochrome c [Geobacter metallireducens GS-15]EHP88230.1 cytochrome C family protein [Geobacter metallireducens RCH3]